MYYVYELRDPRTSISFYGGKGCGGRAYEHQREVLRGTATSNPAKIACIKDILAAGFQVEVAIIAEYPFEEDALAHEFNMVAANPSWTNVMPGGIPTSPLSPLTAATLNVKRLKKLIAELNSILSKHFIKNTAFGTVDLLTRRGRFKAKLAEKFEDEFEISGDRAVSKRTGKDQRLKSLKSRIAAAKEALQKAETLEIQERKLAQHKRARV